MELAGELFLTASLAIFLSFIIAKLVAMAMAVGHSDNKPDGVPDDGVVQAEARYEESLRARGSESERRAEFVEEAVEKVQRLEEEIVEEVQRRQEEGSGEETETVGSPVEVTSEGQKRSSDEKALEFDARGGDEAGADDDSAEGLANRGVEETGAKLATNDVVALKTEAVRAESGESDAKDEANGVELHNIGDEDDWEGIERNELENDFAAAVKFVESAAMESGRPAVLGSDILVELYGLRKVATEGSCHEPQPAALDLSARAKCDGGHWLRCARNAWQRLGNMTPEMAMEQYVTILSDYVPGWMEGPSAGEIGKVPAEEEMSHAVAPVSSTLLHPQSNIADERESEPKSGALRDDFTGSLDLENRAAG